MEDKNSENDGFIYEKYKLYLIYIEMNAYMIY